LLIENISELQIDRKARAFRSFASKFVHWFVDERCPILDSFAIRILDQLLGLPTRNTSKEGAFVEFARDLGELKRRANLTCSERELDRYLWLAGQCQRIKENEGREQSKAKLLPVNGELQRLWNVQRVELQEPFHTLLRPTWCG
jgi:hypothetical protein